jgi:hypothetical protein
MGLEEFRPFLTCFKSKYCEWNRFETVLASHFAHFPVTTSPPKYQSGDVSTQDSLFHARPFTSLDVPEQYSLDLDRYCLPVVSA